MRLLARRRGRSPTRRDEGSLEDRAAAIGVKPKEASRGQEGPTMRANKKTVTAKEEAYLTAHPVLPPGPTNHPPDTPEEMREAAERALAFERPTGEFAIGKCGACKETRRNATYRKGGGRRREDLSQMPL